MSSPLSTHWSIHDKILRRALRMMIALFIGVFVYRGFDLLQGFWVILTITVVMQATIAATLRKGLQRFAGTIVGLLLGSLVVMYIHNAIMIDALLVISLFIAYWSKSFNLVNYGIFVIPLSFMVVCLISSIVPAENAALAWARLYDSVIGIVISLIATFLVFPTSIKPETQLCSQEIKTRIKQYLSALERLLIHDDKDSVRQARDAYLTTLTKHRELFSDWRYEIWHKKSNKTPHLNELEKTESIGQHLMALQRLFRHKPDEQDTNVLLNHIHLLEQSLENNNDFKSINFSHNEWEKSYTCIVNQLGKELLGKKILVFTT